MTEAQFYNKVTWTTFIFGVLVVMIHGYNIDLFMGTGAESGSVSGASGGFAAAVAAFEKIISDAAPIMAVTGFFIISGYLFYRNISWDNILQKMTRRVGSVLVPYIVWNVLYYALFSFAGQFPALWGLTGREGVPFTIAGLADAVLNYTYNPVLWYLKQLVILIAIAPFVYALMSGLWRGAVIMLLMLAVISKGIIIPVLNLDALLYFSLGAFLGIHAGKLVEREDGSSLRDRRKKILTALAGAVLSVLLYVGYIRYSSILLTVLFAVAAPVTVWLALPSSLPGAKAYMNYSLFLYSFHFLPVRAINKIGSLVLPHNAVTGLCVYIALPVIVVCLTWGIAVIMKKKIPPLWKLLSGGR